MRVPLKCLTCPEKWERGDVWPYDTSTVGGSWNSSPSETCPAICSASVPPLTGGIDAHSLQDSVVLLKFSFDCFPCDMWQGRGQFHSVPHQITLVCVQPVCPVCPCNQQCQHISGALCQASFPSSLFQGPNHFWGNLGFRSSAYCRPSQILLILLLWSDAWRNREFGRSSFFFLLSLNHLIHI